MTLLPYTTLFRSLALAPDGADHLEPVDPGDEQIEQHKVGGGRAEQAQSLLAVTGPFGAETTLPQERFEYLRDVTLVLNDQDQGHVRKIGRASCRERRDDSEDGSACERKAEAGR